MVETELQIINISIIFPSLDSTCINHDLHNSHKSTVPTLPTALSINVLALGTGTLQSLTHLLSGKMLSNFLFQQAGMIHNCENSRFIFSAGNYVT